MRSFCFRLFFSFVVLSTLLLYTSCTQEDIDPREEVTYNVTYKLINHLSHKQNFRIAVRDPKFANLVQFTRDTINYFEYSCEMYTLDMAYMATGVYCDSAHFDIQIVVDSTIEARDSLFVPPIGVTDSILNKIEYLLP